MVERHLIGPLQSNKAREAVGLFEHLISILLRKLGCDAGHAPPGTIAVYEPAV
jgi:hypothetical protein